MVLWVEMGAEDIWLGGGYKADPEIFCFSWGEEPSSDWDILGRCGVGNTLTTESNGFPIFGKNLFEFFKTL